MTSGSFGFLWQQLHLTSSWYSPDTKGNRILEEHALQYRLEREIVQRELLGHNKKPHCPPCEHFERCGEVAKVLLQPDLQEKFKAERDNSTTTSLSTEKYYKNASGWVCRNPTLVDKLPQTFIHRTTDYHFHRLVGTPKNVTSLLSS